MKDTKARSQNEIFAAMHRELRSWNSDIPESPDRLDPILKIMLQLYAGQLARIDRRVDNLWEIATDALVTSLYPEARRWPVPAYTVMHCTPADELVEIDRHTTFFYREKRDGGQSFFFAPQRTERLVNATVARILVQAGDSLIELSPEQGQSGTARSHGTALPERVFFAVEYAGDPSDIAGTHLFIHGDRDALRQLRWGYWYPSSADGNFYEDSGFCPGTTFSLERLVSPDEHGRTDWGGLRSSAELFGKLEDHFVTFPETFCRTWQLGSPPPDLARLLASHGILLDSEAGRYYWIRVDLPPEGNKQTLAGPIDASFSCVLVTNRNEQTLFKHTGGNRLVEIEIPEDLSGILGITNIVDSDGIVYRPRHEIHADPTQASYALEERDGHLVIWFDYTSRMDLPPDSLTVTYAVTGGIDANGIDRGEIVDLYESHPGIAEARNLLTTTGAIPAKTRREIVDEITLRLRARDRALSFEEIARWATTFDPRIRTAACSNGIQLSENGIRRCIVVNIEIPGRDFCSNDEIELLKTRLAAFLKSRAPVNTQFEITSTSL